MRRAERKAWGQLVNKKSNIPLQKPKKKPSIRVVKPTGKINGRTMKTLLKSLENQITSEQLDMECELVQDERTIRIVWKEEEEK